MRVDRLDHLVLTVHDVEDAVAELNRHGVPTVAGPLPRTGALGPIVSVYFRDPDGNLIEVSNYPR